MSDVVSVRGLGKAYGALQAVHEVDLEVQRGEVFALLGPNGAGKSTTLEILEGFRRRDCGQVEVLGVDPGDPRTHRWLRERLGVVLQELAVEPFLTVRQVLARNAGYFSAPRSVEETAELIGLGHRLDARVKTLSGGQQRRLDVGLGLIGRPELLVLDEPTTGLDPEGRRSTWDLVRGLAREGTTVILSSHYMDEVDALADRMAVMAHGSVVARGTPSSIGGRDRGAVTIRFQVPLELAATLPAGVEASPEGTVEVVTADEVGVLHAVTGWALERGVALSGLTVARVTLEDVYLRLTGSTLEAGETGS